MDNNLDPATISKILTAANLLRASGEEKRLETKKINQESFPKKWQILDMDKD